MKILERSWKNFRLVIKDGREQWRNTAFEKFGFDEVFSNLVQAEIIEPISGHGKGKYKFKKYGSIWEDDKDQSKTNAGNALRMAI